MINSSSAEAKITKAKAQLVYQHPFYAIIALALPFIEAPWCKTMATDGVNIYWGRDFVDKLSIRELVGVIAHEVLHVAWFHMTRKGLRDHKMWNYAGDIVINKTLEDGGFVLPDGGWSVKTQGGEWLKKYDNWSTEAIYNDLKKNAIKVTVRFDSPDGKEGEGDGEDTVWGGVIDPIDGNGKKLSPSEIREIEQEVRERVVQAAESAKKIGKLPGGLEGLIKAVGKPTVNWKEYIQHWVSGHTPDNYSWRRPNRQMFTNYRIYMPRLELHGAGHGILSIDTSGSVSDDELRSYVREIAGVIELCSPDKLTIIQHDAVIQSVREWEAGDDFNDLKIKGRGGTMIGPSFKYAEEMDETPDWMICFTDMGICDFPPAPGPSFPVLWCATGDTQAPFGVHLDLRNMFG